MNLYCSLEAFKRDIQERGSQDDARLLSTLEAVSRWIDGRTGRHFYAYATTRYLDGEGRASLLLPWDVASLSACGVDAGDDGTYEYTLVEGTDYRLWPLNRVNTPAWRIELLSRGTQLSTWPRGQSSVRLTGQFGYSNEQRSAGTLGAEVSSASVTSVTMTAGHSVEVGHTIVIDSEQLYVSGRAGDTLTVERGVNGTTAATHTNATAVTRREYPEPIVRACLMEASRVYKDSQTGYSSSVGNPDYGGYESRAMYGKIVSLLEPFERLVVA